MVLMVKTEKKEEKKEEKRFERPPFEKGVIKVSTKTNMKSYTPALMAELSNNGKVVVKAMGKAISKAVDLTEFTRNRLVKNCKVEKICIGTAQFPAKDSDRQINVSTIEITLTK